MRIAFSPSGRWLASGGLHGDLKVWSVAGGRLKRRLQPHASAVRALAWRDDVFLVSVDKKGEFRVHNVETGMVTTRRLPGPVYAMAISPDRRRLLLGQGVGVLWVDAGSFRVLAEANLGSPVLSVAVNAAGTRVAVSTRDGRVQVAGMGLVDWREIERPPTDAFDLHFTPDGGTLLAGAWFSLLTWDTGDGVLRTRPARHPGQVISVDISPDARRWISLGRQTDSSLYLIDAQSNKVLRRMQSHELCGWQARFSPDGRYVASAGEEGSIRLYDLSEPYRPVTVWGDESD